jgi:hypothetical protein
MAETFLWPSHFCCWSRGHVSLPCCAPCAAPAKLARSRRAACSVPRLAPPPPYRRSARLPAPLACPLTAVAPDEPPQRCDSHLPESLSLSNVSGHALSGRMAPGEVPGQGALLDRLAAACHSV